MNKQESFYQRLKKELEKSQSWPATYMYKFILPSDTDKINTLIDLFRDTNPILRTKSSKGGKYTSVSIEAVMTNPDAVISKYKEAASIQGIISL